MAKHFKVLALLSGGKDSCFSMLECRRQGHEVVALASLHPPSEIEELDSFLYQSVGQSHVQLIADALELPLYRRQILGTAINTTGEYYGAATQDSESPGDQDETEDLFQLITEVRRHHPEVDAVCSGAILSNYQRVRVEDVCARQRLVSLAPLWRRDQTVLLDEMAATGMSSIIIKVAGMGLGPGDLGSNVCSEEFRNRVRGLNQEYSLHPCGEGGEYETYTVDSPLFHRRIHIQDSVPVITDPSPWAPVAHLRIKHAKLVPKDDEDTKLEDLARGEFSQRDLIEDSLEFMLDAASGDLPNPRNLIDALPTPSLHNHPRTHVHQWGKWTAIQNVTASTMDLSLEDETEGAFSILLQSLQQRNLSVQDVCHVNLYLAASSMPQFAEVNAIYSKFFRFSSPPSRACVSIELPQPLQVKIDVIACKNPNGQESRRGLHVQSQSLWAPANIGPYSQGITIASRTFAAGQIPLIPATLTLSDPDDFALAVVLAFQHAKRIITAVQEDAGRQASAGWLELVICWISARTIEDWQLKLTVARAAWQVYTSEHPTPVLFARASDLPKGATIEWQFLHHTGERALSLSDEDEDDNLDLDPKYSQDTGGVVDHETLESPDGLSSTSLQASDDLNSITPPASTSSTRLFHRSSSDVSLWQAHATVIPVLHLATLYRSDVQYSLVSLK